MKLWPTTTENKCFVKMLWHLLGEYVKVTVLLVCSICTVYHFFYFFPRHRFVLFKAAMSLQYFGIVHLTYFTMQHFSCNSPMVSWVIHFFFFLTLLFKFCTVATVPSGTVATVAFFSLPFVFLYIYCYTDTTNFTIFSQLLRCQFLISQNKIIKYEIVTNHN